MKKLDTAWKLFGGYVLLLFFMLMSSGAFSQIKIIQFNAGWNAGNTVSWAQDLKDCKTIS